jgi:hypothetical protein
VGRPKRTNKAAEWKALVTLATKYDGAGKPVPGPAVQVTYATVDGEARFSHTPGIVISADRSFRPVQHLHDRHIEEYLMLLMDTAMAVVTAKRAGMVFVEARRDLFEKAVREGQQAARRAEKVKMAAEDIIAGGRSTGHVQPRKKEVLTATLEDMLKAKGAKS